MTRFPKLAPALLVGLVALLSMDVFSFGQDEAPAPLCQGAEKQTPRDPAPEKRGPEAPPTLLSLLKAGRSVMFVGAHPDDESAAGALLARAADQAKAIVVCFTKGEGGENQIGKERNAALSAIRARELAAACEVLVLCQFKERG